MTAIFVALIIIAAVAATTFSISSTDLLGSMTR